MASQEHERFLARQLARLQADFDKFETDTAAQTTRRADLDTQRQTHLIAATGLTGRVARWRETLADLRAEGQLLRQRRAAALPEYSLVGGLFFLAAGLAFLFGDLIISHEIVAYALNIRDNTEAWAFAVGLASVTILLKPAYDRLLEKPYRANPERYQVRYQRFTLTLSTFALLTLAVLGWFRYEAYRTDQQKAAINKSIRQWQQTLAPPDDGTPTPPDPAMLTQLERQLKQVDALNLTLVNSPWAMLSFVLSGVLFAGAGAVCLGIGLPVLAAFWFRWCQADRRLWVLRRRERTLLAQLGPAETALNEHLLYHQFAQQALHHVPDPATRQTQRADLLTELLRIGNDHRLALTDRRMAEANPPD